MNVGTVLRQPARRAFFGLFALLLFFLPFELPIAQAMHGTLHPVVGALLPAFFVGSLLLFASAALALTAGATTGVLAGEGIRDYAILGTLFVTLGVYACLTTFGDGGNVDGSLRELVLGHAAPIAICGALLLEGRADRRAAWTAFYCGYAAYLLMSFGFLALSYRAAAASDNPFVQLPGGVRLFMWRYTFGEPWNLYAQVIGNANKTSNNVLIFLLLSTRLLGEERVRTDRRTRGVYLAFWAVGLVTLIILFSRAALLLLPVAVVASGVHRHVPRRVKFGVAGVAVTSLAAATAAYRDVIGYLLTARTADDELGFAGTYGSRVEQWSAALAYARDRPRVIATGLGTSGYGLRFFGDSVAGTHNTVLDTFFESGIVGVALLLLVFVVASALCIDRRRARVRDPLALSAIVVMLLLMTREHSFSYLFATSLGGFCVAAIFYVLADPRTTGTSPAPARERLA